MISPELQAQIDREMEELSSKEYRSVQSSVDDFIGGYSTLLTQAQRDIGKLEAAGFPLEQMDKFRGYLDVLSDTNVERVVTLPQMSPERTDFNQRMNATLPYKVKLRMVTEHIRDVVGTDEIKKVYRLIAEGSGQVDDLQDIRRYISVIRTYPEIASEMRPGGVLMTPELLDTIDADAKSLLMDLGITDHPRSEAVDRQNRILTLCLNARTYLKKYAKAAFVDDPDYYDRYYADKAKKPAAEEKEMETV